MASLLDERVGPPVGAPAAADLAGLWLEHALVHLRAAYEAPAAEERLETCRLAVLFAALAVETRLNGVLRGSSVGLWSALAPLTPGEKLRLAPRLLGNGRTASLPRPPDDAVARLFDLRDDLVGAGARRGATPAETSWRFETSSARAMVEAGAEVCRFLAAIAGRGEDAAARRVCEAVEALPRRGATEPVAPPPAGPGSYWDLDFPPDLVGS